MPFAGDNNDHFHFKNHQAEVRIFTVRLLVSLVGVIFLFGMLMYRFYSLQVIEHEDYVTRSDSNRIQTIPLPPTRGLIYDRNGELLAYNRPSYTLSIVKEHAKDIEGKLDIIRALIEVSDADKENFYHALKRRLRPYEPIPLRYRLTEEEIAIIAVNEYRLGGVEIGAQLVRHYPHKTLFAHTLGYVGRINERELSSFTKQNMQRYSGTHTIGKIGIERYYEDQLIGTVGWQHIEKNAHGRILRVLRREDPVPGDDLHLHLDIRLQKAAADALNGERGAVVLMDVATGGVLSIVSAPSYDPNLFVTGISYKNYDALNTSRDLPLFNRTIQGQYPPGSTLKPIIGLGGLETGLITPESNVSDPGFYKYSESQRVYRCWSKWGHGKIVDLRRAIVESCDTYFYDLAMKLGIDQMYPLGAFFGLGDKTGIDIPSERPGLWPSRPWKEGAKGLPWFPGDSLNVSIGQGFVLSTPVQLAAMTAAIATRGELKTPQLARQVGDVIKAPNIKSKLEARGENWEYIASSMEDVVHAPRGTAKGIRGGIQYRMAGKTGTAQVISIAEDEEYDRDKIAARKRDHALFVAFTPVQDPEVAIAVIFENGEHGSSKAAPVARKVFDEWHRIQQEEQNIVPPTGDQAGQAISVLPKDDANL